MVSVPNGVGEGIQVGERCARHNDRRWIRLARGRCAPLDATHVAHPRDGGPSRNRKVICGSKGKMARACSSRLRREALRVARVATRGTALSAQESSLETSSFLRYATPQPSMQSYGADLDGPPTEVTTLKNGLRVATETVPFAQTATIGVWIDAGSRFESARSNGTAHFLEHMAFKGTKTRTTKGLEEEVENLGAHLNAYTSREQTTYYAKVLKADVPKAVDILSDILQNSSLNEAAVERERSVILREMEEIEGQPEEVLFDHLHATAFQHSPLGRTILGPADNVRSITRGDLADYIAAHYTAPRMVITGAGAVEHQQLVKLAEQSFASLPTEGVSTSDLLLTEPSIFTGSDVRIQDDDMPACHFAIAFEGASWTNPDSITLMVMQSLLGSWDKGSYAGINSGPRLAQNVAANKLCNSYTAFNTNYADTGLFGVYAVSEAAEDLDDLSFFIMNELTSMCYSVDPDDLMRAKNQLKASLVLSMDNTSASCEDIGRQLLTYGRRIPKSEMFARIDAVTEADIKAAADKYIYDKDVAIAAMGKTQFLPDYNWFRRRTYWLRY